MSDQEEIETGDQDKENAEVESDILEDEAKEKYINTAATSIRM